MLLEQRARGEVTLGQPVSEEVLAASEKSVGRFPPSYRRFAAEFGWLETPTFVVFGVGERVPEHLHVVLRTERLRAEVVPELPTGFIAISGDRHGNFYCLLAANEAEADAEGVYARDVEFEEGELRMYKTGDDFGVWLAERVEWFNT